MSTVETYDDPFEAHFRRDPLPTGGVRIIMITDLPPESARTVIAPAIAWLEAAGRPRESRIIAIGGTESRLCDALNSGLDGLDFPLVLVTTALEPLTPGHLAPLFEAIDRCDHAVGRRRLGLGARVARLLLNWPRRIVFAVPVLDVHSPCQLHRAEKLASIPFQSRSSFLDVEILAKATFLGHLLDEVEIPPLRGQVQRRGWFADLAEVFKRPLFKKPASGPAEELESQVERDGGPGDENPQGPADVEKSGSFEQDQTESVDQLR